MNRNKKKLAVAVTKIIVGCALVGFFLYITIDTAVHHEDGNLLVRSVLVVCLLLGGWLIYKGIKRILNNK